MSITVNASDILDALSDAGVDITEHTVRPYSGRGMYGKECLGVVLDSPADLLAFAREVREQKDDDYRNALSEFAEVVDDALSDNLGLRVICYWPGVQLAGEES